MDRKYEVFQKVPQAHHKDRVFVRCRTVTLLLYACKIVYCHPTGQSSGYCLVMVTSSPKQYRSHPVSCIGVACSLQKDADNPSVLVS